ncbi:hypothetical protein HID58_029642 [Brassica napus]|uniref:Uncharacterized protein n=1 Tax=Brassica napus TaxID=3708 RepID=A0ABQ8CDP0_BRANA|nr:hypothetical protein HID58_029642 [Brassica napus]
MQRPWTTEEDKKLINFILNNGHCCWRALPKLAGLRRCGKSCRLRWTNYLRPDLRRGLLSHEEEQLVIDLHAHMGNNFKFMLKFKFYVLTETRDFIQNPGWDRRIVHSTEIYKVNCMWSKIASRLPGRTDNEIKNHWNTHIKKKLVKMGIDPVTHQPLNQDPNSTDNPKNSCSVSDDISMVTKSSSTKNIETNGTTTEDESISTITDQNSSMDNDNHQLSNIYNDEELFSYLWSDESTKAETPWSDSNYDVGGTLYHDNNEQIFRYVHRKESTAWIGRFRIIVKTLVYMILVEKLYAY